MGRARKRTQAPTLCRDLENFVIENSAFTSSRVITRHRISCTYSPQDMVEDYCEGSLLKLPVGNEVSLCGGSLLGVRSSQKHLTF